MILRNDTVKGRKWSLLILWILICKIFFLNPLTIKVSYLPFSLYVVAMNINNLLPKGIMMFNRIFREMVSIASRIFITLLRNLFPYGSSSSSVAVIISSAKVHKMYLLYAFIFVKW